MSGGEEPNNKEKEDTPVPSQLDFDNMTYGDLRTEAKKVGISTGRKKKEKIIKELKTKYGYKIETEENETPKPSSKRGRKRALEKDEQEKDNEPPSKKARKTDHNDADGIENDTGKKLHRSYTHTNPETGEKEKRLHHVIEKPKEKTTDNVDENIVKTVTVTVTEEGEKHQAIPESAKTHDIVVTTTTETHDIVVTTTAISQVEQISELPKICDATAECEKEKTVTMNQPSSVIKDCSPNKETETKTICTKIENSKSPPINGTSCQL